MEHLTANPEGMTMIKFNVRDRFSGEIKFVAEIDCDENALPSLKLGLAVKWAVKEKANLRYADLSSADLRSFKADLWMTLTQNSHEVPALIGALREGRVDGSTYEGECACLVGTIANAKAVSYDVLDHSESNPAEQWFAMIRKGDKPEDESAGGFASKMALDWALEFCALSGIEVDVPAPIEPVAA